MLDAGLEIKKQPQGVAVKEEVFHQARPYTQNPEFCQPSTEWQLLAFLRNATKSQACGSLVKLLLSMCETQDLIPSFVLFL